MLPDHVPWKNSKGNLKKSSFSFITGDLGWCFDPVTFKYNHFSSSLT